ncbi:TetR/AcrR family transcriptional regulator [Pseudonocardia sp. DSM 110487]|uniref:TetR/AcrR family transcriptional regulator n=1 Tax=Pseudonocardia sp. DSM 110487 TaxID=2865833 RepID=UPI0021049AF9|nr:TetR family transcriptional regulator [Pseudonocardia sp. DSM 110487]
MITDGRRRKGEQRRRQLLDATMRVIERAGVAAVSQRVVAHEAGVPPSAVTYYFPAVDDLLVAALADCNDIYLSGLDACARDADPIAALARLIADGTGARRAYVAAEYELFLIAARRPEMQPEAARWADAVDAFLRPYADDPIVRAGVAAAVDGLLLRCFVSAEPPSADEVHAVLARLVGH